MTDLSPEELKRIGYLQRLCNKYGNFRVAYLFKKQDGEIIHTKWRNILECWESEDGLRFLSKANNREPLPNEIFIDLDTEQENETRQETFNAICDFLEEKKEKYIGYKSGSKGYHIHIYDNSIALMNKYEREKVKESIIKDSQMKNADILKYSDNAMLAIENVPHWKTGNKKERVRGNWEIL